MLPWQHRKSLQCHPAAVGTLVNKRVKGKSPAKRLWSKLSTLRAKMASWNVWRKMIRKRKKPKRKVLGFNWSTSLLHLEMHTLWEPTERSLSCRNPVPMNSWHDKKKTNHKRPPNCKNVSLNWVEVCIPSPKEVFKANFNCVLIQWVMSLLSKFSVFFFLEDVRWFIVQYIPLVRNCQKLFIKYLY